MMLDQQSGEAGYHFSTEANAGFTRLVVNRVTTPTYACNSPHEPVRIDGLAMRLTLKRMAREEAPELRRIE